MTPAKLQELAQGVVAAVKDYVSLALLPLQEHIGMLRTQRESSDQLLADLEERVAKLERERRASE